MWTDFYQNITHPVCLDSFISSNFWILMMLPPLHSIKRKSGSKATTNSTKNRIQIMEIGNEKKNGSFKSNLSQCWIWIWKLWIRANIIWERKRTIYKHIHYTQDIWNSCIFFLQKLSSFWHIRIECIAAFCDCVCRQIFTTHTSIIYMIMRFGVEHVFFGFFLSFCRFHLVQICLSQTQTKRELHSKPYGIEWETNEYFTN